MKTESKYMARALQLAAHGFPHAFPNPMVGAVIVDPQGIIIGEGYHRCCGEAHAEVNAVKSVSDKNLLRNSTMYVTLEPCAHYGRTPPCAKLIIDNEIPNVVIGTRDPFDSVNGKGIDMLKAAGINVEVGLMEKECRQINTVFFTAHTLHRPFIMLKWAQSADGYMDIDRTTHMQAARISTPTTSIMVHRLRSCFDAIAVGSGTVIADNPMLNNRLCPGKSPRPVVFGNIAASDGSRIFERDPILFTRSIDLDEAMHRLYDSKIYSLLVEGGPTLLKSFLDHGLWDVIRVETSPQSFGDNGRAKAPFIGEMKPCLDFVVDRQNVKYYSKNVLADVKNS